MKHIKIIIGVILGILLIVSGTFFFLKITQVKVEGGDIYSDQQIIASAMSDQIRLSYTVFSGKEQAGTCGLPAVCAGD